MKLLQMIAVAPWWVFFRLVRMEKREPEFSWSWHQLVNEPMTWFGLITGWLFWVVLIAALILVSLH